MWLSIKYVRSQGGGVCPVWTMEEVGSSDADVRTFWCKKFGFFEMYGVSARIRGRGIEPVGIFCGHGGRRSQFFAILCGRLLWMSFKK